MLLVVTGGGTGGHVFPALEVAREAKDSGFQIHYLGSQRGQEGKACAKLGLPFTGFPSHPVYSLKSLRGWKGLMSLLRSKGMAQRTLRELRPAAVFSTGGYSSAPVVGAARSLGIPYIIHEQNSVPGRTNKILSRGANAIAVTFESSLHHFEGKVLRTGMPVRAELRSQAHQRTLESEAGHGRVLVMGGSQGSAAINEASLATAQRLTARNLRWLNLTGKANFEGLFASYQKLGIAGFYELKAFLEGAQMGEEYSHSSLVVARAGTGTISELAAFRLPSILVPYPHAYANHQYHNAKEFESIGAATILEQASLSPAVLENAVMEWLDDPSAVRKAQISMAEWDRPDAAERILELVRSAAGKPN